MTPLPTCPLDDCNTGKVDLKTLAQQLNGVDENKVQFHAKSGTLAIDHNGTTYISATEDHLRTTESSARYAAFLGRLAGLARYLAYTSDLGESFRPVVNKRVVQASYGISWAYVIGDVTYDAYVANTTYGIQGLDLVKQVVQRGTFQALASMALPAFTIHSVVHYSGAMFKRAGRFQKWGGTVCGLGVIPLLPYMFDEPVEHALSWGFHAVWPAENKIIHSERQFIAA